MPSYLQNKNCFGSLIEKECTKGVRNFSVAELLEEFIKNKYQ